MISVKEEKNRARKDILQKRGRISPEERKAMDDRICRIIASLATYRYADSVLFYYPLGGEVGINSAIEKALEDKKKVYLPRCKRGEKGAMDFYLVDDLALLEQGLFGVMEPPESLPVYSKDEVGDNAICIMPGLTFDEEGYRLGYGKGYYDRYMNDFNGIKIGVVYSQLMYRSVPHGFYDVRADIIITERGL